MIRGHTPFQKNLRGHFSAENGRLSVEKVVHLCVSMCNSEIFGRRKSRSRSASKLFRFSQPVSRVSPRRERNNCQNPAATCAWWSRESSCPPPRSFDADSFICLCQDLCFGSLHCHSRFSSRQAKCATLQRFGCPILSYDLCRPLFILCRTYYLSSFLSVLS